MKSKLAKSLATLLCVMTAVAFMPTFAFANDTVSEAQAEGVVEQTTEQVITEEQMTEQQSSDEQETVSAQESEDVSTAEGSTPADDAKVTITVSDQGIIASDKSGNAMVDKDVTVKDLDSDGHLSYDEALVAAHKEYHPDGADGYNADSGQWGLYVTKIWGKNTGNCFFMTNGEKNASGVDQSEVKEGDKLYVSVNKDDTNYADWYTYFNKTSKEVDQYESFTLNLKGYQGMGGTDAKNIEGVKVGIWNEGTFEQIGTAVTNKSGNAEIKINEPGSYIVTAYGTVNDTWTDWSGKSSTADCPIMAPACEVEVKAVPQVNKTIEVFLTVNDKGTFATDKNGKVMVDRKVTVEDIDEDDVFSYNEALVAAHKEYCSDGEGGYGKGGTNWVNKLWGEETGNINFRVNGEALPTGVDGDKVETGDKLYASILKDGKYYSDVYSEFDKNVKEASVGETVTLKLTTDEGATPISDAKIGILNEDGTFQQIQHKETDTEGKVKLVFDTAGTYYITTKDAVVNNCEATDWSIYDLGGNPSVYGYIDFESEDFDSFVAYTDTDYGDGPYPADEVKYVDFFDWNDEQDSYHALHSNQVLTTATAMPAVCKVIVGSDEGNVIKELKKTLADIKALSITPRVTASATSTKSVVLKWSNAIAPDGCELSTDGGKTWQDVTENSKAFSGLAPGTTYSYKMKAYVYVDGTGSDKVYSEIATAAATTPIGATAITSLKSKSKKLTVQYAAVEGATGYEIWIGTNSAVTKGVKKYTSGSTSLKTKKLKKGKKYYVKVRAYKGGVYGPWTAAKKIKCK